MSILVIDTIEPKNDAFTTLVHAEHVGLGTVDDTEFSYLNGASSNIQDQLNTKDVVLTAGTGLSRVTNQFSLSFLGLESLADPAADRIVFWDETDNALKWLAPSTGLQITGTNLTTKDSEIAHDSLSGYSANRHIDHTAVSISPGTGMSGGGDLSATRTLTCTITQYTDALARAAISSSATGLTYTSATGVLSLTAGYVIPTTTQESAWTAKMDSPMTTAGDLILGGVSGAAGRLAIGANTYVLTSNGTTAAWAAAAAGTTVHSSLTNLAYADAGHSGFEPTVTKGNLTEATSSVLTIGSGNAAVIGAGTTIQVKQAATGQSGYLSNTDWNTFNGKMGNPMTAVGDTIYGGASGTPTTLVAGLNTKVLTLVGGVPVWKYGGLENDVFGVFQTLLETYRIAGRGITALLDGIVINGLSSGWPNSALSSNSTSDETYGFRYPTGGSVLFVYNEWGDFTATAVGDVANNELRHAQSFTLAGNSAIAGVSLGIYSADGGITDDMTVRVETDTAGSPSGTLAHADLTKAQAITPLTWNNFTFAAGSGSVDQSQETGTTNFYLGDSGGTEYRGAQSFIPSGNLNCPQVAIYFRTRVNTPSGNVTLRIETQSGSLPSGNLVDANATKAITITDNAWNVFSFPAAVALAAGTTYWIVLACDNQTTNYRWCGGCNIAGGYANGRWVTSTTGGASWSEDGAGAYDMAFRVYTTVVTLASGTYWVVVSVPAQATGAAYRWSVSRSNPYAGGALKRSTNGGAWAVINASDDGMFKVWAADTVAVNATIVSAAIPLSLTPTHCRFLVLYSETNDALTINTDVLLYASRDGGTTFTQLTATSATVDPRWKVAYGVVDISGQPAGTSGSFKVATANNKNVFFHGYAAQWY